MMVIGQGPQLIDDVTIAIGQWLVETPNKKVMKWIVQEHLKG